MARNRKPDIFAVVIKLGSDLGPWTLALVLGLLGMWQFHNVEFYSRFDLVPGGRGDPRLVTALLEYFHQSLHGKGSLDSPAFFYPTPHTLGFADVFFTYAVLYDQLRSLGWDVFSALQACVFTADFLNYACCFLLLWRGFRFSAAAAGLGAFLFAFNAPKFNQIGHVQLQCLFWLPLVLWCLVGWARNHRTLKPFRSFFLLFLAAVMMNLELLSSFYDSWFFIFWTGLFWALALCFQTARNFIADLWSRHQAAIAGAAAAFVVGLIPFLIVYIPVIRQYGEKGYDEVQGMIPTLWSYLWMGPRHSWWGWLWDAFPAIQAMPVEVEERLGFGLVMTFWWIAFVWGSVGILKKGEFRVPGIFLKTGKGVFPTFGAVTILSSSLLALLAFQVNGFSPWWLVYHLVPGAGSIRAVSRLVLVLALPMGIILSWVTHLVWERKWKGIPWHRGVILLLGALLVLEQVSLPPFAAFSKSWELDRLEYLSEKMPALKGAFYVTVDPKLPYTATDIQTDAMLISAVRGIPTLNGYSGQSPANQSWGLFKVRSPQYEQYVKDWVSLNHVMEPVFRLEIDR